MISKKERVRERLDCESQFKWEIIFFAFALIKFYIKNCCLEKDFKF